MTSYRAAEVQAEGQDAAVVLPDGSLWDVYVSDSRSARPREASFRLVAVNLPVEMVRQAAPKAAPWHVMYSRVV